MFSLSQLGDESRRRTLRNIHLFVFAMLSRRKVQTLMSLSQEQLARDTSGVVGDSYCLGASLSRLTHPYTGPGFEGTCQVEGRELRVSQSHSLLESRPD